MVEEFVERGLHGAAGEEHVVHEDDRGAVDVGGNVGRREFLRDGVAADVVAVKGDIERAAAFSTLVRALGRQVDHLGLADADLTGAAGSVRGSPRHWR